MTWWHKDDVISIYIHPEYPVRRFNEVTAMQNADVDMAIEALASAQLNGNIQWAFKRTSIIQKNRMTVQMCL